MDITQTFYDSMASEYDKLFSDWQATTREQAVILDRIFRGSGFDSSASVLDCACGIGTQAIGLAALGYPVTASDISDAELAEAAKRAAENRVSICFEHADFCALDRTFPDLFHQLGHHIHHSLLGNLVFCPIALIQEYCTQHQHHAQDDANNT